MKAKAIKYPIAPEIVSFAIVKLVMYAVAFSDKWDAFSRARKLNIRSHAKQFSYFIGMFILLFFLSCAQQEATIEKGKTFDELLALADEQPFCVVLTDTTQNLSKEYLQLLKADYNSMAKKAVVNLIDISMKESEWYIKWLKPVSLPLTCVFSADGQLLDLIPGSAKESFLYTKQAIENEKMTAYHWPNSFQRSKNELIPFLDQVLAFQSNSDRINNTSGVQGEELSDSLHYPYVDYLLLKAALLNKDSADVIKYAKRLLKQESSATLETYKDEFIVAKKTIDPTFSLRKAPNIRTTNEKITLTDLQAGKSVPIAITLYNDGEEQLNIEKIAMSCTCVYLDGPDSEIVTAGKRSYTAKFNVKPEDKGALSRDIYIYSNALNKPALHINILAHVNP